MFVSLIFLVFFVLLQDPKFGSGQPDCPRQYCSSEGPVVRFPFRLKGRQDASCGYRGFDLSCNNRKTVFEFQLPVWASARNIIIPLSVNATVEGINYRNQEIRVSSVTALSCLPTRVREVNSSAASPFKLVTSHQSYTLFNCSGKPDNNNNQGPINCLDRGGFQVYAISSFYSLSDVSSLSNCFKMYNISDTPNSIVSAPGSFSLHKTTRLSWSEPNCRSCESRGKMDYCGFKIDRTNNEIQCFKKPKPPGQKKEEKLRKVLTAVGVVVGTLMSMVLGALYTIYLKKKRKIENQRRIVQFLDDYRALRPTRYTYSDIKKITEGFKHKLGRGGYGTVFKGMLSSEIPVAVKILSNIKGNGEEFLNEVGTIGNIHHVNVVRLVGYCADGYRRALVYEFLENDSLEKYISWGIERSKLTWDKLFEIALGIAKGVEYLHQGCNQRILHFDIKPQNILLDQNLNPKVADFGLAKLCSREKSVITMTAARGTIGYIAPEVFSRNFGRVSYKSDIYSFGMVLLDMVGGRKNFRENVQNTSTQVYFPEWMYEQLDKGEDIDFQVENEDEVGIVKRLIIVGLWCIQWYPIDRPSMKIVIQMLEGPNLPIMPPNPFAATNSGDTDDMGLSESSFSSAEISIGGNNKG